MQGVRKHTPVFSARLAFLLVGKRMRFTVDVTRGLDGVTIRLLDPKNLERSLQVFRIPWSILIALGIGGDNGGD